MSERLENLRLEAEPVRLSLDGLPYKVQEVINTYARALNCPKEYVTGPAMVAASQAAGNMFVWQKGTHKCYPQFYAALLGDSTVSKTGSIRVMLKPLKEEDYKLYSRWKSDTAEMKKDEAAKIPLKCYLVNEATLEAYQLKLSENPQGITFQNDELLSFFGGLNRYNPNGADEKFYLTCFGNYENFTRARVGETRCIQHPIVRIVGGIQPDVLKPYFEGSTMLADGMLPRFLWFDVPSDFMFDVSGENVDIKDAEKTWSGIIHKLLDQKNEVELVFEDRAWQIYNNYKIDHYKAKNKRTLYGYEASICGKLEIYAIIWAMTTRILRYAAEDEPEDNRLMIVEGDINYSLSCMEYFRKTAMKVYDIITNGKGLNPADCIRGLSAMIKNQSLFAEAIGKSHQYVNKVLNG